MSKIAIDVVLLPDPPMSDKAIELCKRQHEKFGGKIELKKEKCLPHISLAMGVIEESDLTECDKILKEIAAVNKIFILAAGYRFNKIPSGGIVSEFTIKKTAELQSLHEAIMTKLKPFLSYDVSIGMIFSPPAVEGITLHWIKNYAKASSFGNFRPHVTIGFGKLDDAISSVDFTASRLAICHLGNYCTCRKILFSETIKK